MRNNELIAYHLDASRENAKYAKNALSPDVAYTNTKNSIMYMRSAIRRMDDMINLDSYKEFDVATERTCCPSRTGEPHNGYCSFLYQGGMMAGDGHDSYRNPWTSDGTWRTHERI